MLLEGKRQPLICIFHVIWSPEYSKLNGSLTGNNSTNILLKGMFKRMDIKQGKSCDVLLQGTELVDMNGSSEQAFHLELC